MNAIPALLIPACIHGFALAHGDLLVESSQLTAWCTQAPAMQSRSAGSGGLRWCCTGCGTAPGPRRWAGNHRACCSENCLAACRSGGSNGHPIPARGYTCITSWSYACLPRDLILMASLCRQQCLKTCTGKQVGQVKVGVTKRLHAAPFPCLHPGQLKCLAKHPGNWHVRGSCWSAP